MNVRLHQNPKSMQFWETVVAKNERKEKLYRKTNVCVCVWMSSQRNGFKIDETLNGFYTCDDCFVFLDSRHVTWKQH